MTQKSIGKRIKETVFFWKRRRQPKDWHYLHGVCDSTGGDFKEYFFNEDMPRIIAALKHGMDKKSCDLIDLSIERLKNFPNQAMAKGFMVEEGLLMTQEERDAQEEWEKLIPEYQWDYPLVGGYLLPEAFMYHHGLRDLPENIKDYIRGKDFIDAGAFIGDSAIVLHKYEPAKVFSFEISRVNADKYLKNM